MDFSSVVGFLKDRFPRPIEYFKNVARGDTPSRVSAVLALSAGIALVAGFVSLILAITIYKQHLATELATISAALVTLSTFSKVDRNDTTTQSVITKNDTTTTIVDQLTQGPTGATGSPGPPIPVAPLPVVKSPGIGSDD